MDCPKCYYNLNTHKENGPCGDAHDTCVKCLKIRIDELTTILDARDIENMLVKRPEPPAETVTMNYAVDLWRCSHEDTCPVTQEAERCLLPAGHDGRHAMYCTAKRKLVVTHPDPPIFPSNPVRFFGKKNL